MRLDFRPLGIGQYIDRYVALRPQGASHLQTNENPQFTENGGVQVVSFIICLF